MRSKSQTADEQLESHRLHLRRVREAHGCGCKVRESAIIRELRDQVKLCQEMLSAICHLPLESKHMVGKFYLSQLLENVRHKQAWRQADMNQVV